MARKKKQDAAYAAIAEEVSGPPIDAAKIKELYNKGQSAIRAEQLNFILNQCFLDGQQWVFLNDQTGTIENFRKLDDEVYATVNKLLPNSVGIAAKVLSRKMKFQVLPADADDVSVKGANTGESVLNSRCDVDSWEVKREETFWAAWQGGTAVVALDWDAEAGQMLTTPVMGQQLATGEACLTVLDITEVCWTPGAKDAERASWWIRAQALPPEEVQDYYDLPKLPKADINSQASPLVKGLSQRNLGSQTPQLTLVLTYYERPSTKNPKGRIATVVNDQVVGGVKAWYFPWKDRLNIKVFKQTKVLRKATGTTVLSAAVPIQVLLNASESSIQRHLKKAAVVKTYVPEGSVDIEDLTNSVNEYIEYDAIYGKPEQQPIQEQAGWWIQRPDKLSLQIDDILGYHGVSRGQAPGSLQSGLGLSMLLEADSNPLGAMVKELAMGWQTLGSMILRLYADKVTEPRKASVRTPHGIPEMRDWTGKALASQFDVQIPLDSVMPRDHASMQAFAQTLLQAGFIQDAQVFLRMIEVGDPEDLIQQINPDVAKAERVVNWLSQGIACPPVPWDVHDIHIKILHTFMKSARFDYLPNDIQQMFIDQVQAHVTMATEEAGQQVARANASPVLATLPTTSGAAPLPPGVPVNPQVDTIAPPMAAPPVVAPGSPPPVAP
jgi:hypothetical protein